MQGPGVLRFNQPDSRTPSPVNSGGEISTGHNDIRAGFDLDLYSFSFGPVMEWQRGAWSIQASAGLTPADAASPAPRGGPSF